MFLSGQTVAIYCLSAVVAVLACYVVGGLIFRKDTEAEKRRAAAIEVAAKLQELGLRRVPSFLKKFAIYDWSGMYADLKQLADLFTGDPRAVAQEFEQVFDRVFSIKLATAEGRALIAAKLAEAVKPAEAPKPAV